MERVESKNIHKLLDSQKSMIQTRDEIIDIIKKENFCLAAENRRLMRKVLELQQEKAT